MGQPADALEVGFPPTTSGIDAGSTLWMWVPCIAGCRRGVSSRRPVERGLASCVRALRDLRPLAGQGQRKRPMVKRAPPFKERKPSLDERTVTRVA